MRRREFISWLGGVATATASLRGASAQQARVKRVVFVSAGAEDDPQEQARVAILRDGLGKLGWVDGRNLKFESVWRGGSAERAKVYVAALVGNPPDLVIAGTLLAFLAIRRDARTVPMMFVNLPDPVAMGLVSNLAKPDGNFTGFTAYEFEIARKWLQVLKELAPHVSRVAMTIGNSTRPVGENFYHSLQIAAGSSGVECTPIHIDNASDVQAGIETFALKPNGGLVIAADAGGMTNRALIIELAARHRLPAIYPFRHIAREGGLASYGIDFLDLFRGAVTYADRILRGAKPADLPIQAPTKFEFVINLKTAKALGLTIPLPLLGRADEVIE